MPVKCSNDPPVGKPRPQRLFLSVQVNQLKSSGPPEATGSYAWEQLVGELLSLPLSSYTRAVYEELLSIFPTAVRTRSGVAEYKGSILKGLVSPSLFLTLIFIPRASFLRFSRSSNRYQNSTCVTAALFGRDSGGHMSAKFFPDFHVCLAFPQLSIRTFSDKCPMTEKGTY